MSISGLRGLEFELKTTIFLFFLFVELSVYILNITLVLPNERLIQMVGHPRVGLRGRKFDSH